MKGANRDCGIPESVLREGERKRQALAHPLRAVGYWQDPDDAKTANLPDPHNLVDTSWDRAERKRVIRYLRSGRELVACRGSSWCRFACGASNWRMGYRDLTDGEYVWPEGFAHYVKAHSVKPPAAFLDHVRRKLAQRHETLLQRIARFFRRG